MKAGGNCVNASNFETPKSRYLQPKGSFFVLLVGFPIAKLLFSTKEWCNKTPKVVSVGCVGLWKDNGVLSEFGKIRETGKMCHVISIDDTCMGWFNVLMTEQERMN